MSLIAKIVALAQAIGADIKTLAASKQDKLVSGQTIKTINGASVLGPGDVNTRSISGDQSAANFVLGDQTTNWAGTFGFANGNGPGVQMWGFSALGAGRLYFVTNTGVLQQSPAGVGYSNGAGGSATQPVSKSTGVTLNKPCGQITLHPAALAAGATVRFAVTNNLVSSSTADTVIVCGLWGAVDPSNYRIEIDKIGSNVFYVRVTNISAGALSEALVIGYALIKGAIA